MLLLIENPERDYRNEITAAQAGTQEMMDEGPGKMTKAFRPAAMSRSISCCILPDH